MTREIGIQLVANVGNEKISREYSIVRICGPSSGSEASEVSCISASGDVPGASNVRGGDASASASFESTVARPTAWFLHLIVFYLLKYLKF